jgi:hypothetical protein
MAAANIAGLQRQKRRLPAAVHAMCRPARDGKTSTA